MPSFFSKVFGRKKDEKELLSPTTPTTEKRSSAPPLLDGKYESVSSSNVSPSIDKFPDNARLTAGPSKDSPLALFRPKSKHVEQTRKSNVKTAPAPLLTLNLPQEKQESNRALDVVFESLPEDLAERDVGERRLSPAETLRLVQACSKAIVEHGGLETLGLMYPHWYAASNEVQRRLVFLFLLSLKSKLPASSPESASALFDSELKYTSPHDVAAVLRWALRHLKLEGTSFGKDASEWEWYATFASSERQADFPPAAFSKTLIPLLPSSHVQLLTTTLDIIESLAAHAEVNGSSGSKLSKLFGLWLVSAQRVNKEEDWAEFYKRWETAGRILEHLFLAHVREESSLLKMPLRLSELVKQYPYGTISSEEDKDSLPFLVQPRFSTRRYDALFVRLNTKLRSIDSPKPPRQHPLHLVSEAIKAKTSEDITLTDDVTTVWDDIKRQALAGEKAADGSPILSQVLDDETIRILSLVPGWEAKTVSPTQPTDTAPPTTSNTRVPTNRRRSSSLGHAVKPAANGNGNGATAAPPTDWADFSKLGFGESSLGQNLNLSLNDSDVEVTTPTVDPSKRRRASSPGRGRQPLDNSRAGGQQGRSGASSSQEPQPLLTHVGTVTIDEAFFEFWSDALLDPIAADWPTFAVYQLKPAAWKYTILVVEQTFTRPAPPPLPPIPQFENTGRRASSPRPSLAPSGRGRRSFNFSPTIKRFSFFSNTSATEINAKIAAQKAKGVPASQTKSPKIGELGQILPEETEAPSTKPKKESAPQGLGISIAKPVQDDKEKQTKDASAAIQPEEKGPEQNVAATPAVPEGKENEDLPPVPLSEAKPVETAESAAELPSATIEPVNTEEDASTRPLISSDEAHHIAADLSANSDAKDEEQLPPAPEAVVLSGSTSGPQAALETSEPVALAQVSEEVSASTTEPVADAVEHPPTPPAKDEIAVEATEAQSSEVPAVAEAEEPVAQAEEHDEVDTPAPVEPTTEQAPIEPTTTTEPESAAGPSPAAEEVKSDEAPTPAATTQSEKEAVEEQQKDEPAPATPEPAPVVTEAAVVPDESVPEHADLPPTTNVDEVSEPSAAAPVAHEPLDETVANGDNTESDPPKEGTDTANAGP